MGKRLNITFDSELIDSISADFDLRTPNKEALRALIFTLNGEYDPNVMQVCNLATGVGKTYLMAAFIEYLRQQGIGNVVIVTPGKVVQTKTVQNFAPGNTRYIEGAQMPPDVVTPQDYSVWISRMNGDPGIYYGRENPMLIFIFNIQQLIAPKDMDGDTHGSTQDSERRRPRKFDENAGVLFDYLKELDNLVVIADESHLYSSSAVAFNAALKELDPAATIGLTASVLPGDHVIYRYPLYKAIADEYVKSPVLAFRKGGYGEDQASEEQQLRDALQLRELKQMYYDTFTEANKLSHLNAIVFVVCADVDHATQITELLRSPGYLGKELSVLQVDSQHDDEMTQKLLADLDRPDSPVLAVVSVNKLKEGWDVKNIVVVVTLRAMASEVLTQQTMGRGLRLPFKKYTKVRQIDQLDIISHQSFQELLAAEDVLAQFGLDEAVSEDDKEKVKEDIRNIAKQAEQGTSYPGDDIVAPDNSTLNEEHSYNAGSKLNDSSDASSSYNHQTDSEDSMESSNDRSSTVGVREIDNSTSEQGYTDIKPLVVERNPEFADVSYKFPVTNIDMTQPVIDLSDITDKEIDEAAKRVASTGDVLYRKEIIAALGKKLRVVDTESAEVDSEHIKDTDAAETLVKLVINMQMVPRNEQTIGYVESFLIPKFMKGVTFSEWTVKSLGSARGQLLELIKAYISNVQRSTKEVTVIHPMEMPLTEHIYPIGTVAYEPIERREEFVRGRVYSGWFKSLYTEESFDSYSGEYKLATLMNISPHIVWWHRLHSYYEAYIYYTMKDRYFPDFVALDDNGIHWIIEGKDKRGRDNKQVDDKRKAAEAVVRKMSAQKEYSGEKWGYMIAFEDDIEKADSWDDLKTLAQPVTNII